MGQFGNWGECVCPGGKDGPDGPCVEEGSGKTCSKKRVQPVAKMAKYGGQDNCKEKKEDQDCTKKCKHMNNVGR